MLDLLAGQELKTRRDHVAAAVHDGVADLLYFLRKSDSELPVHAIEDSIIEGEVTLDEITELFRSMLNDSIAERMSARARQAATTNVGGPDPL